MYKHFIYLSSILLLLFVASCKSAIKPEELYGKWKYIKVEHPGNPDDTLRSADLAYLAPYIQFNTNNDVVMIWGGKILSHGKFHTEGQNIIVKEQLPNGQKREFPFWVVSLTDKQIVFETKVNDKSRVTAVRE